MSFLIGAVLGATLGVIIGGINRANSEYDIWDAGFKAGSAVKQPGAHGDD